MSLFLWCFHALVGIYSQRPLLQNSSENSLSLFITDSVVALVVNGDCAEVGFLSIVTQFLAELTSCTG